jgi:hypothetical protein
LKKVRRYTTIIFFATVVCTSCRTPRYVYSSEAHNVPSLTQQGDSRLGILYANNLPANGSTTSEGFDVQGAYAITDNLAVQASWYNRFEKSSFEDVVSNNNVSKYNLKYRRKMATVGVGYFNSISKSQMVWVQIFAGIGIGKFYMNEAGTNIPATGSSTSYSNYFNTNVTKFYLQPAFIIKTKKQFETSFSNRISIVAFKNVNTNYTAAEQQLYKLDSVSYRPRVFWEPNMLFSFGNKKLPGLKWETQIGFSFLYSNLFIDYRFFNFSTGFVFDVPRLLKGHKNAIRAKKEAAAQKQ